MGNRHAAAPVRLALHNAMLTARCEMVPVARMRPSMPHSRADAPPDTPAGRTSGHCNIRSVGRRALLRRLHRTARTRRAYGCGAQPAGGLGARGRSVFRLARLLVRPLLSRATAPSSAECPGSAPVYMASAGWHSLPWRPGFQLRIPSEYERERQIVRVKGVVEIRKGGHHDLGFLQ